MSLLVLPLACGSGTDSPGPAGGGTGGQAGTAAAGTGGQAGAAGAGGVAGHGGNAGAHGGAAGQGTGGQGAGGQGAGIGGTGGQATAGSGGHGAGGTGGVTGGGGHGGGGAAGHGGGGSGGAGGEFSAVVAIFANHCTICHDASLSGNLPTYPGLSLTAADAYGALVNRPADETCGGTRVVPGDPNGSYLVQKITQATPCDGDQMPRPFEVGPVQHLSSTEIATITAWISAGAPH